LCFICRTDIELRLKDGSISSLLADTSIKEIIIGNTSSGISNQLSDWYIIHMQALLERCHTYMENSWGNWNHSFCRKAFVRMNFFCILGFNISVIWYVNLNTFVSLLSKTLYIWCVIFKLSAISLTLYLSNYEVWHILFC
jgi:hypothetical protein